MLTLLLRNIQRTRILPDIYNSYIETKSYLPNRKYFIYRDILTADKLVKISNRFVVIVTLTTN